MLTINDLREKLENLAELYDRPVPERVGKKSLDKWLTKAVMPYIEREVAKAFEAHATHEDFLMASPSDLEEYKVDIELALTERKLEKALSL